ncbi:hypothetical protein [Neobacillus fumarioli]|uniref:hypothetical protein n=1 Tax=Neobacillus fumarioli TaxID=105229 RepID=UPI00082B1890|nr:hypothetical protein [Neobacillus fumarioli]
MNNLRKLPFANLFMPKRKRRGTMWASLIGLGISISAAAFGITRGRRKNNNDVLPFSNAIRNITPKLNIRPKMNVGNMDNAALTEFSEELLSSAINNNQNKK